MKKWLLGSLILFTLLIIGCGVFVYGMLQPLNASDPQTKRFTIPKGQAITVIGERLAEEGFIRHPLVFRWVVKSKNLGSKLQAGSFMLSPSMSTEQIAIELTKGTNDVWITIPEGWRREEIAASLLEYDLPEYDEDEFLELTASAEGKLFPDTYLVPRESTAQTLALLLTNTFEKKIIQGLSQDIADSNQDLNAVLVMASLVEREARGYEEMRRVAGILWKRIEIGMPLQVDATLQYSKGYSTQQRSWWVPPTAEDKKVSSPFNTYANLGLPPRPISNPGLNAIKAALNPVESDNLFYIHDRSGIIHYAQTLEQHNENVERYLR